MQDGVGGEEWDAELHNEAACPDATTGSTNATIPTSSLMPTQPGSPLAGS